MRGTGSHDLVLEDVFVPAEKIAGTRPYGEPSGPFHPLTPEATLELVGRRALA